MSDAVTPLGGASLSAAIDVLDAGVTGMITLRGDLSAPAVQEVSTRATGCEMPGQRRITHSDGNALAWMSPDELLLVVPYASAEATVAEVASALAGTHHLVANVSDARQLITLDGPGLRDVLAKGSPADLRPGSFPVGEIRRTRLGQVACAVWLSTPTRAQLVCFRSVAPFVFEWLAETSKEGSLPGYFS